MSIASDGDTPMSTPTLGQLAERVSLLESALKASTDSVAALQVTLIQYYYSGKTCVFSGGEKHASVRLLPGFYVVGTS